MKFPKWLIQLSIWANSITCGPRGYSICARLWEGRIEGRPLHTVAAKVTDRLFWFDPDHCRKAWLYRNNNPQPCKIDKLRASFVRWQTKRSTYIALTSMTPRQLKDIGLTQGDIQRIVEDI